ncbi:hypothetical protein F4781DRAFT_81036 [Annulohypoxylon bovei var. microspora]|nr:hypothetical protein F4781DRAFT_81036 [Annulohypoxylon bovei var. microspora]
MASGSNTSADPFQAAADAFMKKETAKIPTGIPYNWTPFFSALSEGNLAVNGVNSIRSGEKGNMKPGRATKDQVYKPGQGAEAIPKEPNTGSWDYVWYIPEWSHPDFDPGISRNFTGEVRAISRRDPIHRLYPALRAADLVKGPTPWAKRFGIHPDEPGGRSRLSPTLSSTRDPFADFANQINMLSDDARKLAIAESRNAATRAGGPLPTDPNYIDPDVLEGILTQHNTMSGRILKERLEGELKKAGDLNDTRNLDTFIEKLNEQSPNTFQFHRRFLEHSLNDQDYQRIIFNDLTSDDLIAHNFFTMSDMSAAAYDLDNEIHPLFQRFRWLNSDWKGTIPREPRFLYNMNGERVEWDVSTNDDLWTALEPALRLVSLVLASNPPFLDSIMDLRTRKRIDPARDQRSDPETPFLYSYNPTEDIDMTQVPYEIDALDRRGFNWIDTTWDVLHRTFRLDISSGYLNLEKDQDQMTVQEMVSYTYGTTRSAMAGPDSCIFVNVNAELIWPLLMPQYSWSEKMTASFQIASTLLHEFGHAVNQAHHLLTHSQELTVDMGISQANINDLNALRDQMWDFKNQQGEPVWMDLAKPEVGFNFEKALWGSPVFNLLQHSNLFRSRQLQTVPLIATHMQWPFSERTPSAGEALSGGVYPVEDLVQPLPLDYMAKFFTKAFWEEDFVIYGHDALKLLPGNIALKTIMRPEWIDDKRARVTFGRSEWYFLVYVTGLLSNNEYFTLSEYISRSAWLVLMPEAFVDRWKLEIEIWQSSSLTSIDNCVAKLNETIDEARDISHASQDTEQNLLVKWQQYAAQTANPNDVMSFEGWKTEIHIRLNELFTIGGVLMREFSEIYTLYMNDLRFLQRMIFDCFNVYPGAREHSHDTHMFGWQSVPPIEAAYDRMIYDRNQLNDLYATIYSISAIQPPGPIKGDWEEWGVRYGYCWNMYNDLVNMLEGPPDSNDTTWKKRFGSVPSSYWKSSADRIQVLAYREYIRADSRIRAVVDDCMQLVRNAEKGARLAPPFEPPDVNTVTQAIKGTNPLGQSKSKVNPKAFTGVFSWVQPPAGKGGHPKQAPPPVPPAAAGPSTAAGTQKATGVVFGQPNLLGRVLKPGGSPSRRDGVASSSKSAGDTKSGSGGLIGKSGRKKSSPGTSGGSRKVTQSFRDWAKRGGFAGALSGVGRGAPSTGFGPGGAIPAQAGTGIQSAFTASGQSRTLFASANADAITITSDVQYYQGRLPPNVHGQQPYSTTATYRDTRLGLDPELDPEPEPQPSPESPGNIPPLPPSPSIVFEPNYVPTPYVSPGLLATNPINIDDDSDDDYSDLPDFSDLLPPGPALNIDENYEIQPVFSDQVWGFDSGTPDMNWGPNHDSDDDIT